MEALSHNTTIKLGIEHNLTSLKVIEARFDLGQTILSVKENIEARFGSAVAYTQLQLKDTKGNLVANLSEEMKSLGQYGAQSGMIIFVTDSNPNSILKQIESLEGFEKYVMSEQEYDKLPENFRKWKKNFLQNHPEYMEESKPMVNSNQLDPDYLSELASSISVGSRCKLESGARGGVSFVGKIADLGPGYYVGVKLDEPYGNSNGKVKGVKYFEADNKYGQFVRPNTL